MKESQQRRASLSQFFVILLACSIKVLDSESAFRLLVSVAMFY